MAGGATVGSGRAYRLDPNKLPARSSGGAAAAAFIIEGDSAIVSRSLAAGPTETIPLSSYRGVSVRMESTGDSGEVRAFVELLHNDPSLTLLLAVTDDPYEIAADWQVWGRTLNLPLLVVGQDGSVGMPLAPTGVQMGVAKPRRRHAFFAKRRPRFLTRRKPGRANGAERVTGREIIARH